MERVEVDRQFNVSTTVYNEKLCCVIKYNQKYIKIAPAVFLREQFLIQARKVEKYLDNCTADDGKNWQFQSSFPNECNAMLIFAESNISTIWESIRAGGIKEWKVLIPLQGLKNN